MGRGATKAAGNVYYQARIEAAKWNGSLSSREGAAEALGVSVDTVKNIELGLHKCVPVDLVVLMADLYNAPYLLGAYCKNECPIGCNYPIATMMTPVERTTLKLINLLDPGKLEDVKRELISIAEDGEITEDEIPSLQEILEYADKLISNLRIYDHPRDLWEFSGLQRETEFGLAPKPITRPPQSWRYVEEQI